VRASPPGHARKQGARRNTFAAALEQAQEFARAAEAAGYATKPILLFYALSQASRAVCAAKLDEDWVRIGHGLSVPERGEGLPTVAIKAGSGGLYGGVLETVDESPISGEVTIGDLLAAHPEFADLALPDDRPRPLLARPAASFPPEADLLDSTAVVGALFLLLDGLPELGSREDFVEALAQYPSLAGARPAEQPTRLPGGVLSPEEERNGIVYRRAILPATMFPVVRVDVRGELLRDLVRRFEEIAPHGVQGDPINQRWIQPAVGEPKQIVGAFSSWWALLLGLSSLARYRPAEWVRVLDVDRSDHAVLLERVLDRAEEALPHHILGALDRL
jgi:hypothetical protein